MTTPSSALIEPQDLARLLAEAPDNLVLVDATYGVMNPVYAQARIGNAVFFDIDDVADHDNPLPHMVPDADDFAAAVTAMGIRNDSQIVIYDQSGIAMAAARVWWMFRLYGHDNVRVLNGGLPLWVAMGLPMNVGPASTPTPAATPFRAAYRPHLVCNHAAVDDARTRPDEYLILDARSPDRFAGTVAEPRPHLTSGHIPNSRNLFFMDMIDPGTARLIPNHPATAEMIRAGAGKQIITSCGSGVTACVLALALHEMGRNDVAVYDGSWCEWGQKALNSAISVG
ncbi:sulfurtransferase [Micavibrio aeruginosavorus]|uniref:sulfurtransferase n=1 Tax=Micavibrio aeruginosavorus TaxID=349221 RepID=UPI003F4AA479